MTKSAYEMIAQVISSNAGTLSETELNGLKALLDGFNNPQSQDQTSFPGFTIKVNYDQTVEQLIKEGKYDLSNYEITSENFPSTKKGQIEETIYLMNFDRNMSREDAVREMDKQRLRPATLKELLALSVSRPELQRCNSIIALGSSWRETDGQVRVPCLRGYKTYRSLCLEWIGSVWGSDWRFAAVRK